MAICGVFYTHIYTRNYTGLLQNTTDPHLTAQDVCEYTDLIISCYKTSHPRSRQNTKPSCFATKTLYMYESHWELLSWLSEFSALLLIIKCKSILSTYLIVTIAIKQQIYECRYLNIRVISKNLSPDFASKYQHDLDIYLFYTGKVRVNNMTLTCIVCSFALFLILLR